jgi:hypothetical protein
MKVARHEMPGAVRCGSRPVGYGMVSGACSICLGRCTKPSATNHTVPYGTVHVCPLPRHFMPSYHHAVPTGLHAFPTINLTLDYRPR